MLTLDPSKRASCEEALNHAFLKDVNPDEIEPPSFPEWQDCHEMWSKERKKQQRENAEAKRGMPTTGKIPDVQEPKSLGGANFNAKQAISTINNTTNSNIGTSKPFPGSKPFTGSKPFPGSTTSNTVRPKEHLPPPPPLPSLLGGVSLGMGAAGGNTNRQPPNESRPPPNFTNRGIMNPTGLPKKVEKLSDYSSDLKPPATLGGVNNTYSADVKLNHFISKPVNSGSTGAGGSHQHAKWPT